MRKIDLTKIKVAGVANNSVLVYNNVSSSWIASNTVAANIDWSYIGNVPYANSTANGVVRIVDSTSNTSTTIAASAASVKLAFDAAGANGGAAYANAVTYINSTAATAYANAVTYANTIAATAYTNAASIAATAYSNAIAYAASNTYVNSTFAPLASPTLTGLLTANNVTITGNLTVSGTTTYVNSTQLNIGDNILTLNADHSGSPTENAGFEVMRGTSANVSFLWDETSDYFAASANLTVSGTLTANIISVSNVAQTQSNLQVDPAGTSAALAIIFGG